MNENYATLHEAIAARNLPAVQSMIAEGTNPDCKDKNGFPPLQLACFLDTMGSLYSLCFYYHVKNSIPGTESIITRHAMVQTLLNAGVDVNAMGIDLDGQVVSVLLHSCMYDSQVTQMLIRHGADLTVEDDQGRNILYYARRWANQDSVNFALQHGAKENQASLHIKVELETLAGQQAKLEPRADLRVPSARIEAMGWSEIYTVIFSLVDSLEQKGIELRDLNLTPGQQAVYLVLKANGQICNGGFDQWIYNSTGEWAWETTEGMKRLNASRKAALLIQALNALPNGICPKNEEQRHELLDGLSDDVYEVWKTLENEYYKCKEDDLEVLCKEYIIQEPEEFFC